MEILDRIWNLLPFVVALATVGWLYYRARIRVATRRINAPARLMPESQYTVVISDTQIAVQRPDHKLERAEIEDIDRIVVRTNSLGPWRPDFWWEFYTSSGLACSFPEGATGQESALELAGRLPGFDFENFNHAIGSTTDAEFLCWQRPNNSFKPTPLRGVGKVP